jgi:UDP-glucose 4-epimerase
VDATVNETYNIGADQPVTVLDLAEVVANAFDAPLNVKHLEARNEVVHAFSDHTKVRGALELNNPIDIRDGIARMAAWVHEHGAREPVRFKGEIEVARNLPPSWIDS